MPIIVQKYGGSSVADIDKLQRVARKVANAKEAGYDVVVVVSAMGNTTNDLLALARGIHAAPDRRELDMLLSVGERISMALLSMGIHALGHQAISFTGSQCGIITTDSHSAARIIEVRPFRVQDELERGRIVIVAGYQGTSYKKEVTTLGRGGSDMTAVALAGALGAVACEIYSDVDGVFTADPRVVLDARRLDEMSAEEVLELARHGAKVLHDEAVAYARRHGVALYAKSTHEADSKGTIVRPDGWPDDALNRAAIAPRGVAALPRVLAIDGTVPEGFDPLAAIADAEPAATVVFAQFDGERIRLLLDPTNCADAESSAERLRQLLGPGVVVRTDLTNVTIVGQDIGRSLHWLRSMRRELSADAVEITRQHASSHAITALIPKTQRETALRSCHRLVVS